MNHEVWSEYPTLIAHWRPQFGNERHIQALDAIAQINRLAPRYEKARLQYEQQSKSGRRASRKRLDQLHEEITTLKRLVIAAIKGV